MGTTFTVRFKDAVVERVEPTGAEVLIGRSEDCQIRIDNLGVSRHHARLEELNGFWVLRDLGSQNGVYLGGERVADRVLNPGDVLSIGKYQIEFAGEIPGGGSKPAAGSHTDGGFDATLQLNAVSLKGGGGSGLQAKGYLQGGGRQVQLEQAVSVIGKAAQADVVLSGFFTPRVVAVIVRDERGFLIQNTGKSANSVLVNGLPVATHSRLEDGAAISFLGKFAYTFHSGRPV